MPLDANPNPADPPPLSERINKVLAEIKTVFQQGVEHPKFEFKRSASPTREDLDDRLDFIKFLQGVANCDLNEERYIVIGADPKDGQFYSVTNADDFDGARIFPVLIKYLEPLPKIEIFNNLKTEEGQVIVVIIINAEQSQPIMVKTEGKKEGGKTKLQVGDIWVKSGTGLKLASRADIDQMYRKRMEDEAESRARQRFKHFNDISGQPPAGKANTAMPVRELLVGPPEDFRRFAEELIATNDRIRYQILLELAREPLVQAWNRNIEVSANSIQSDAPDPNNQFFRDEFLPATQAIVTLALLLVKFDVHPEWFPSLIDVLVEGFEESRRHNRGGSVYSVRRSDTLQWWRPGFEIYVCLHAIAIYIVLRKRAKYLPTILQGFVTPLDLDNYPAPKSPILFWPFNVSPIAEPELQRGRAPYYWNHRISSWSSYFGGYEKYLSASCQLEFILEFNSWLCQNPLNDNAVAGYLKTAIKDQNLGYNPDLFAYSLQETAPIANQFYEDISTKRFPDPQYEIVPKLIELTFDKKSDPLSVLGAFLWHLLGWQSSWMLSNRRFPYHFNYEGRLAELVAKQKAIEEKKRTQG